MLLRHLKISISLLTIPCFVYAASDEGRPSEHYCPIMMAVMEDPVVAEDGHTYERAAIERHLRSSNKSPLTRQHLRDVLVPNLALRKMIADWRPEVPHPPSVLDNQAPEDLERFSRRLEEEFAKNEALLKQEQSAKDRHIVAFLGNTGAGKSTLINLIAGIKMNFTDGEYTLKNPKDPRAMRIGAGGSSETVYPKAIDVGDLRFFDLPGFNDTDGSERNLINAAFIRKILLEASSVRLVFVVGEDQFTADRGSSVKSMFQAVQRLFVVVKNESQPNNLINESEPNKLINDSIFVVTKSHRKGNKKNNLLNHLIKKISNAQANEQSDLMKQLTFWGKQGRFFHIYHSSRDVKNKQQKDDLLALIQKAQSTKIFGINVSVLYPPDTHIALGNMFRSTMEKFFQSQLNKKLEIVSAYNQEISKYTAQDFWENIETIFCEEYPSINLLKEFCAHPYRKAWEDGRKDRYEKQITSHVENLKNSLKRRIDNIKNRTTEKLKKIIQENVPNNDGSGLPRLDFSYHIHFYEQVCGTGIHELADDQEEQEIVRRCYADFINKHSYQQIITCVGEYMKQLVNESKLKVEEQINKSKLEIDKKIEAHEKESKSEFVELKNRLRAREEACNNSDREVKRLKTEIRILRSVGGLNIPQIVRGHEEAYVRFMEAKLIYTHPQTKVTKEFEFSKIMPQLFRDGVYSVPFDLAGCDDVTKKYVSINIGFRVNKNPANDDRCEVWIMPRFWLAAHINGVAAHYKPVFDKWTDQIPAGIFWTGGWWNDKEGDCAYDVIETYEELSNNENLYKKYVKSPGDRTLVRSLRWFAHGAEAQEACFSRFVFNLN